MRRILAIVTALVSLFFVFYFVRLGDGTAMAAGPLILRDWRRCGPP